MTGFKFLTTITIGILLNLSSQFGIAFQNLGVETGDRVTIPNDPILVAENWDQDSTYFDDSNDVTLSHAPIRVQRSFETSAKRPLSSIDVWPRWQASWSRLQSNDLAYQNTQIKTTIATYPFFGPPPPFISIGYSYFDFEDSNRFGIPGQFHEFSIGGTVIRKINEQWTLNAFAGISNSSDLQNQTSDAWQFRGGVFGIYSPQEGVQWVLGAVVTGRQDLPVLPAIGLIWNYDRYTRIDLTMPNPSVSFLVSENANLESWLYGGFSLGGNNWAVIDSMGRSDLLEYRENRLKGGLKIARAGTSNSRMLRQYSIDLSVSYAFGRRLEFSSMGNSTKLANGFLVGIEARF